ncbi:dimethylaniline monooxygenase [N-oxide-forming] 2-like [Ostrea edulis]|uniref:dimethylaniline monooxygenase [N-oxide-forming] 2-like n=1 Tax=Ostrea edulis TaxID=37623 RepID=UPI0024AFEB4B|nr:dimethylaniline monooxygenase [N-oxide-forming] 2-like [Ostrea edulis]
MSRKGYKQRVAVIGAGVAGLCSLKHLAEKPDLFEPVAFERNFWSGGIWNFTDQTGNDDFGLPVHSPVYNSLKINIPKELQEFPSFPYPKEWKTSYISRQQCLEYINRFTDHFKLRQYIRMHTLVRNVEPLIETEENGRVKWLVTYSSVNHMPEVNTEVFDSVLVCNGHDFNEYIPNISGMDIFEGRMIHSKDFRYEEQFDGLRVAILGVHFSGEDISMHLGRFARKVYACHRRKPEEFPPSFPKEIEQRPPIVRMTKDSVVFPDGSSEKVDAVIFCTGYQFSFPFLKADIITITDERVEPVYKHMVHIEYPNLMFIEIPRQWMYFPNFHEMAKLAVLILAGKVKLPSKKEMLADSEADFQARLKEGKPPSFAHYMGDKDRQFRYNEQLAKLGGFDPLPPVLEMLWHDALDERYMNLPHCNELDYVITGPSSYRCLNPEMIKSRKSKAQNVQKN